MRSKSGLDLRHLVIFAMFGALIFVSKKAMEGLPNIHLVGMFTVLLTLVYRWRALIPLYIYIMLDGLTWGFALSWVPYLYIWLPLWGAAMLLPVSRMSKGVKAVVYPVVCALHGLAFGTLYAPAQAIMFGLNFRQTIAWIISGLPFDGLHCFGNFVAGLLILPLSEVMFPIERKTAARAEGRTRNKPGTKSETKPGTKPETKPGTDSETKPGTDLETTPDTKSDSKPGK